MGAVRRYWDIFRLVFIYIKFKYRQYRLKTNETMLVKTTYGPIRGVKRFSCWDDPFYSFEKVPFAKPPLGELRFKAPVPPDPWTEVKDCTKEGPNPLQTNLLINRIEGAEDCLYLNVYTKSLHPARPVPVMVWIYGGGFETGGTTKDFYSPDYFMQRDIVLVSITYRVGPFGFLSLNDPSLDIPGNAGLKDQLLGLKWVQANISKFGGDANNVTLFGESAGAASTNYMMISDQAKDLFHKAVLMSGSVLSPWALVPARNWGYRLAKMVGYDGVNNDAKVFAYIKNASGRALIAGENKLLTKEERHNRIIFPFGPVIEPYVSNHCIIPEHPRFLLRKAWSEKMPVVIGGTSYEGLIFMRDTKKLPSLVNSLGGCEYLAPLELNYPRDSPECKEIGRKIKAIHFNGLDPDMKRIHSYLDVLSYKYFWHPIQRTIYSRLKYATGPNYLYRFDVDSKYFNMVRIFMCGRTVRGACHGDDLIYMFLSVISPLVEKDSMEYRAIQQLVGMLTNFAATGNPNCPELGLGPLSWDPVKANEKPFKCLNLCERAVLIPLPETDKLSVWDTFFPEDKII